MKSIGLVRCDKATRHIVHTSAFKLLHRFGRATCSVNVPLARKNMQRQIMMHPILTMLKHFFLMSWIVLLTIQMNILLVSSVVVLAIGINLVVYSSNSIVISSNSIVILSTYIVVSKKWKILPLWRFFWDLPHSCTYLQVYYMIHRKKICLMMFQILKLGNWIFRLFRDSPLYSCYAKAKFFQKFLYFLA